MRLAASDDAALKYFPCRYGTSRLLFRGPQRDLSGPYFAFLGGTETYGKFLPRPFPAVLEQAIGLPCANLGGINAGVDAYLRDPGVQGVTQGALATVVQVTGAQNLSNRFYSVHPRRNDRFLRASEALRALYAEVDFTNFHFTGHMLATLWETSEDRFALVRAELAQAWAARMRQLVIQVGGPVVLLWFAGHPPPDGAPGPVSDPGAEAEPLFVTRAMIDDLRASVAHYVEVRISARARGQGVQGMVFDPADAQAAAKLPGPAAHEEAADALGPVLHEIARAAGALEP